MFTPEQIATKLETVSASEAPAIVGKHSFVSALDVWALKVGITQYNESEPNEVQQMGLALEGGICQMIGWKEQRDIRVNPPGAEQRTIRSRTLDLVSATPDGFMVRRGDPPLTGVAEAVLEAKYVASPKRAKLWLDPADHPDGIPQETLIQVHWQMAALGVKEAYVGALVWGRLKHYRIPWSQPLFDAVMQRVEEFWERYVIKEEPPPATETSKKALARVYPTHEGEVFLAATEEIDGYFRELNTDRQIIEMWKKQEALVENQIKEYILKAPGVEGDWGRCTWKKSKDSESWDAKKLVALVKSLKVGLFPAYGAELEDRLAACKKTKKGSRPFVFTYNPKELTDGS